ncbi:MAG: hypothetical protein ACRESZ_01550, partial [Methylococcales bacterium]
NTVKRFHYDSVEALKEHLYAYILNYNFKLRAIGRLTPFNAILASYQKAPDIFTIDPNYLSVGLNNYILSLKGNQGSLQEDVSTYFISTLSPDAAVVSIDGDCLVALKPAPFG